MSITINPELDQILNKASGGEQLTTEEAVYLLELEDRADIERVFDTARELKERHFGKKIFLYGFVYFSTYCRNKCAFCYYRRTNEVSRRYRKDHGQVVDISCELARSGVNLIDLTMGEDPFYHNDDQGAASLAALVREVKEKTALPVMISPGVAGERMLQLLAEAGADWYACYQETHNRELFSRTRLGQDYDLRMQCKRRAREKGLLIEEGLMVGIGETAFDIAFSLEAMRSLKAHQVRVMSFVPQEGTEMAEWPTPGRTRELLTIALLRLSFPDRLIPASLDVDGLAGLKQRLSAGANVITSLIPPSIGLAGVAQSEMDIEEGLRSVREVTPVLAGLGLEAAGPEEYRDWINREKSILTRAAG